MSIDPVDHRHQVGRRAGVIGLWTLASRITGFARDIAIAFAFGTGLAADAFFVAFRIPNLLRRLSAEGALTVAFVPVFTQTLKQSRDEAKKVFSLVFTLVLAILLAVTVAGVVAAPWLVRATAWGFTSDPEKFALTVTLTRWVFPFILLVSLAALMMGVLNSLHHFWASAAAPLLLNIGIIAGVLGLGTVVEPPALGMALGVLGGGVLQLAAQLVPTIRRGFIPRLSFGWRHPAVAKLGTMIVPAAYGAAVYQFNVLVMTFLASFLASGSVSYLWYADRVMELPVGIFGIAIATALLPTLSSLAADKHLAALKQTLGYGLSLSSFVNIPAMVGLWVLAEPIVEVLFRRGTFTAASVHHTVTALRCFAVGLPCIAAVRITSTAFYALHDTRTPVKVANVTVALTLILSLLLMKPLGHNGLALALSVAAIGNFLLQLGWLRKKIGRLGLKALIKPHARMSAAAVVMGGLLWLLLRFPVSSIVQVSYVGVGVVLYLGIARLLGCRELGDLIRIIRRRSDDGHHLGAVVPETPNR